jgi:plastocyanin
MGQDFELPVAAPLSDNYRAMSKIILPAIALAAAAAAYAFDSHTERAGSALSGRITWDGERPAALPALTIAADASKGCCPEGVSMDTRDRTLLLHEGGGIANVVVSISVKDATVEPAEQALVVENKHCQFEPHVLVVPVGSAVDFANADGVNHNVHTYPAKNGQMNKNISGGQKETQLLDKAETFKIGCDVHPWMSGWVFVTDTPFTAVTGADGSFALSGLPPGTYKVEWWHESLGKGKFETEVTIEADKAATADFKLNAESGKKKGGRGR